VEKARSDFEATGTSPINSPIPDDYASIAIWWTLFHFGAMPFVVVHNGVQLRKNDCSIWMEVCGNPAFSFWLMFWEIGIFRYPIKVSPLEQWRRCRRWAGLVLCSSISCFAGTGKMCEKPQRAAQHQKYEGLVRGFSLSTATLNSYLGLDGAVFHPGVVQQSSVTANFACGFFGGVWASEPITRRDINPNFGRELDLSFGWSGTISGLSVSGGGTYFAVSPLRRAPAGDLLQTDIMVSKAIPAGKTTLKPYLWIRNVSPLRNGVPHGGTFVHWGSGFAQPLGSRASGNLNLEVVHDPGAFGYSPGVIGRILSDISWKTRVPGLRIQLPLLRVTSPLTHTGDGRGPQLQMGVGLVYSH
jgi:hypothetical protein